MLNQDIALVQKAYPQIYLACHTRHQRRASSGRGLSPADSSLLAHLDEHQGWTPTELARHLNIGKPTLSAALKRLVRLAYVYAEKHPRDRRKTFLRLTPRGAAAMRDTSVLEPARVKRLLQTLTSDERRRAVDGLALLAKAARRLNNGDAAHA